MENSKHQTKAAKAREKWRLLQQGKKLQNQKIKSEENGILLNFAYKR